MTRNDRDVRVMKGNNQDRGGGHQNTFRDTIFPDQQEHTPRCIRATSGWAFPFIDLELATHIDLELATHRLAVTHIPLLHCLVHRTHTAAVQGVLRLGLLPGGPLCWEVDESGEAKRVDVPCIKGGGKCRHGKSRGRWGWGPVLVRRERDPTSAMIPRRPHKQDTLQR